jgi:hypothetical protein
MRFPFATILLQAAAALCDSMNKGDCHLGRETGFKKVCGKSNTTWTDASVYGILRNERYCGDVLARKTWTPDFHDHKSKVNKDKKNKYYQPDHHPAIVSRAQWNATQRILNSLRYRHNGGYLPMMVIDHGALTGYISINRAWAGYDASEFYRVSSIAMGLTEGEMVVDLENEHMPDGGRRFAGVTNDNGVQRIARIRWILPIANNQEKIHGCFSLRQSM